MGLSQRRVLTPKPKTWVSTERQTPPKRFSLAEEAPDAPDRGVHDGDGEGQDGGDSGSEGGRGDHGRFLLQRLFRRIR